MRLFLGCTISFVLGGGLSALGLRTLYGGLEPVEAVVSTRPECPPVAACPPCGPGSVDFSTLEPPSELTEETPGLGDSEHLPGLSATAIAEARAAVTEQVLGDCSEYGPGVALLALTVTATQGQGFIRDAVVVSANRQARLGTTCFERAARRALFEWNGEDGQSPLRLPIALGGG